MSDRELLEYAAKAAVVGEIVCYERNRNCLRIGDRSSYRLWRPLTDDGDALRLAVKLGIYVKHFPALEDDAMEYPGFVEAWRLDESDPIVTEYLNQREQNERLEATRHVIVRAAAEIGKAIK